MDGIGDYTSRLSETLAPIAEVSIITLEGAAPIPGVKLFPVLAPRLRSFKQALRAIKSDAPDWVILQYNAFSWGNRGLNLSLPKFIWLARRHCPNMRVCLMVHEPFVPFSSASFAVMSAWQRPQLWALGQLSELVLFSIESWTERFRPWFPRARVNCLPVSSNIILAKDDSDIESRFGIAPDKFVVGIFGSDHPGRLPEYSIEAARRTIANRPNAVVLCVGSGSLSFVKRMRGIPCIATGPLDPSTVSACISRFDLAISPFADGVSARRGSFMALLEHSKCVVTTIGKSTDTSLARHAGRAFAATETGNIEDFCKCAVRLATDDIIRGDIGYAARELFDQDFSRDRIGHRLLDMLALAP